MDELRKGIAIGMLFGSGGEGHGNLMTKTATENGVYTAAEEIDPETGEIFDPPKDGYSVFTVDLALDDKSVSLSTSQITGSQTAEFEYDPHSENPELEGYSLFTIDLSGVKNDIEDLQQQISDLENELEACHDCWEEVVAALQRYDPTYDPAEGECPSDKVDEVIDKVEEQEDELEQCHDCKDATVAAMQAIDPDYVIPASGCIDDIPPKAYQKGRDDEAEENPPGFEFTPDVTLPEISELIAGDVTVSTPTSEWEIEVFLYAESYDGSVTKRVRTLHTGGESWFFRPAISFIHGDEEHVTMPTNYRYQIGPSASKWVSITGWSIDSSTSVSLSWINQDGNTRSWSGFYAGADLTPLMTGPYIVKNK